MYLVTLHPLKEIATGINLRVFPNDHRGHIFGTDKYLFLQGDPGEV